MNLVIVESPAKARTIEQYLGSDYTVTASMGHVRDLAKSAKAVDIKQDFLVRYEPIPGKEKTIRELRAAAINADTVYLATDPDREGEAISWHLAELLEIPNEKILRVTFNEITKSEVQRSIAAPRTLDMPLINAQQARRVLDRIVGYEISPLLWKKIRRGLSAGRVQSVATRMVVEKEREIRAFIPKEYWTIDAGLARENGSGSFTASYFAPVGAKKAEIPDKAAAMKIVAAAKSGQFIVLSVGHSEKKRNPAPPFTTSSLQQEASRKLGMAPRKTMAVAQQLYEGISINGAMTGLITYMRTDSVRLSEEAVAAGRDYIAGRYGKNYLPASPRKFKTKKDAQDAHEAVRPSHIEYPPETVRASLDNDQFRLYTLIWNRFLGSQMAAAIYDTLTIDAEANGEIFRANHTTVVFPGFTAVYEESTDDEGEAVGAALPDLNVGEPLRLVEINPAQHFTKPPARYTEAALIRAMEEEGIGRPSTYAPTLSTIVDREYVLRNGKQLRPTPLGEVVTEYMENLFSDIVDKAFTAHMEEKLDEVADGNRNWKEMLREFYAGFSDTRAVAEADLENGRLRVPDEPTDQICDECGKPMVIKLGRFGRYVACTGYPDCTNTRALSEPTDGFCPLCGGVVLKKKSKRGYTYYGCEKKGCAFITWDTPQKTVCEECGKTLFRVRYQKVPICENPACGKFVPEDARGYKKKTQAGDNAEDSPNAREKKDGAAEKTAKSGKAGKAAKTSKTAAKKTTAKPKTPAASKTKKSAAKK